MNVIKKRNWFFALSLLVIIPGIYALFAWNLKLGIDFSGGTLWEIKFEKTVSPQELSTFLTKNGTEVGSAASTTNQSVLVRIKATDESKLNELKEKVKNTYGPTQDIRLETVGPTVSKELTQKAFYLIVVTIAGIVSYITWAFRKVRKPASPIAFAVCTIAALIHDIIVVVGIFAILGHFANVEVDSLFITALLTVLGFSVHDTIVVFDRIRENLRKYDDYSFEQVVNHSLLQTMARSLNTSITVILVLLALLLFGGTTIQNFVLALLIGVISVTIGDLNVPDLSSCFLYSSATRCWSSLW
ncbi:protein translocase subunit SecF [Candidatus Curtissbacteria bacterium]|nr:protein translocase subunit SecF [Candidatus Curtissbacteria bacterium]